MMDFALEKRNSLCNIIRELVEDSTTTNDGNVNEFHTGFKEIDNVLNHDKGINDNICVIAGRPGCGKTMVFQNIAVNNAKIGKKVLIISQDMSPKGVAMQIVSNVSNINLSSLITGHLTKDEGEKMLLDLDDCDWLDNISVTNTQFLNIEKLVNEIEYYKHTYDIDIVMIESLQEIRLLNGLKVRTEEDLDDIIDNLFDCINRHNLMLYTLSSVKGSIELNEDKMPTVDDLTNIESVLPRYALTRIITLCRPGYYEPEKYPTYDINANIYLNGLLNKQSLTLTYEPEYQRIKNITLK